MKVSKKAMVTSGELVHFLSRKLLCLPPAFPPFQKYFVIVEKKFFSFFISEEGIFLVLRLIWFLYSAFLISSSLLQSICFMRLWTLIEHSIKFVMSHSLAMKRSYCMTYGGLYTLKIVKMKDLLRKLY